MIKTYYKGKQDQRYQEISQFRAGSWVHVEKPTDNELVELTNRFGLDYGLLTDAIDPHEVPRVEKEEGVTYVFTRMPIHMGSEVTTTPIVIVVARDCLVTIAQYEGLPIWKPFLDHRIQFSTTQKAKLFFQIFHQIHRLYQVFLTDIHRRVRSTTVNLERISNKDITQFVRFERTLNDFLSALSPMRTLLENILSGKFIRLYEDDDDLIEDLSLTTGQLIESCTISLKTIVNVRDAYSTLMTHRLNQTIRFLTAITIILTIPTMIASFFGMNVPIPISSGASFWYIVAGATILSVVLYWILGHQRRF